MKQLASPLAVERPAKRLSRNGYSGGGPARRQTLPIYQSARFMGGWQSGGRPLVGASRLKMEFRESLLELGIAFPL